MTNQQLAEIGRFVNRSFVDDTSRIFARVEVRHHPRDASPALVWRREWTEDDAQVVYDERESLINQVAQVIGDDAGKLRGTQKYHVIAVDHEGHKMGRLILSIHGGDQLEDDDGAGWGEIDPSQRGIMTQLLRTNEALVKSSQMGWAQVIQIQQRMLDKTMRHNERLLEQRFDSLEQIEAAFGAQHERELEMIREGSKHELREKALEKVEMLAPAIVNRIAGKKMLPEPASPKEQMVDKLVSSISAEQANALASAGILSQEQLVLILELLNSQDSETTEPNGK